MEICHSSLPWNESLLFTCSRCVFSMDSSSQRGAKGVTLKVANIERFLNDHHQMRRTTSPSSFLETGKGGLEIIIGRKSTLYRVDGSRTMACAITTLLIVSSLLWGNNPPLTFRIQRTRRRWCVFRHCFASGFGLFCSVAAISYCRQARRSVQYAVKSGLARNYVKFENVVAVFVRRIFLKGDGCYFRGTTDETPSNENWDIRSSRVSHRAGTEPVWFSCFSTQIPVSIILLSGCRRPFCRFVPLFRHSIRSYCSFSELLWSSQRSCL